MNTDVQLLSAYAQTRDAEAFTQLIERYAGLVHAACRRVCGDSADADDAAQEAFAELARQAGRIRVSLPAWLHRVATRCAWRQHQRWKPAAVLSHEPEERIELERNQVLLSQQLDHAISHLPQPLREVVVMRFLEGQDQNAIAARLGLNQATVSRRLDRAVASLRKRLGTGESMLLLLMPVSTRAPLATLTRLRRLAINPPLPLPAGAPYALLATTSLLVLAALLCVALSQHGAAAAAPVPAHPAGPWLNSNPSPPAPALAAVLTHRLSHSARGLDADQVVEVLRGCLDLPADESIMMMPGEYPADTDRQLDVLADHETVRVLLDRICAQGGWRWRELGGRILLDRPLAVDRLRRLDQECSRAIAQLDAPATAAAAQALTASMDLEASAVVLRALADPHLDAPGAVGAAGVQRALLGALAANPPVLMRTMGERLPLALLAADPSCVAGVRSAWARAMAGTAAMTPMLCALPGILGLGDLAPQLRRLVAQPQDVARDLDPQGPLQALALDNLRRFAIWSLGRLHDHAALPAILEQLQAPGGLAAVPCLDAIGALGDHAACAAVISFDPGQDVYLQGGQYSAMCGIAPEQLPALLPPRHPLPPGSSDLPVPEGWLRCGYQDQPSVLVLRCILQQGDRSRLALSIGADSLGNLPSGLLQAALLDVATDSPAQRQLKLEWRAGSGDAVAQALLSGSIHDLSHDADLFQLLQLCTALPPSEASADLAPWQPGLLAVRNASLVLGLIQAGAPELLAEFLARHPADSGLDAHLLYTMQWSTQPAVLQRYLDCLERDPEQVLTSLHGHALASHRMLRLAVEAQLSSPSKPVRAAAMMVLAEGIDGLGLADASRLLDSLEALPQDDIEPRLPQSVDAIPGAHLLPEAVVDREARLELRWLAQAGDPRVRASAASWLSIHMLADLRPVRREILATVLARLEVETDPGVLAQLRAGLRSELDLTTASSWTEYQREALALGGCEDDHASIRDLDALRPRILAALAAGSSPSLHTSGKDRGF